MMICSPMLGQVPHKTHTQPASTISLTVRNYSQYHDLHENKQTCHELSESMTNEAYLDRVSVSYKTSIGCKGRGTNQWSDP